MLSIHYLFRPNEHLVNPSLINGIDAEARMVIPFFLLVGELMTSANVVIRIAELTQALVGHIRGGLGGILTSWFTPHRGGRDHHRRRWRRSS